MMLDPYETPKTQESLEHNHERKSGCLSEPNIGCIIFVLVLPLMVTFIGILFEGTGGGTVFYCVTFGVVVLFYYLVRGLFSMRK
jgi:hypothetical protein